MDTITTLTRTQARREARRYLQATPWAHAVGIAVRENGGVIEVKFTREEVGA